MRKHATSPFKPMTAVCRIEARHDPAGNRDRLYISMIEEGAHPRHPVSDAELVDALRRSRYNKGEPHVADFGACTKDTTATSRAWRFFGERRRITKKITRPLRRNSARFESMQPRTHRRTSRVANRELLKRAIRALTATKRIGHGIGMARAEPPSLNEVETDPPSGNDPGFRTQSKIGEERCGHLEEDVSDTEKGPEFLTNVAGFSALSRNHGPQRIL